MDITSPLQNNSNKLFLVSTFKGYQLSNLSHLTIQFTCTAFGRQPYLERITYITLYIWAANLVVVGFKPETFWTIVQYPNHWAYSCNGCIIVGFQLSLEYTPLTPPKDQYELINQGNANYKTLITCTNNSLYRIVPNWIKLSWKSS